MRAYFFGNMYLSSIQQGIQAQHCTTNMFKKYLPRPTEVGECRFNAIDETIQLMDWAWDHETDILLNGGYSEALQAIYDAFEDTDNPYPYAKFNEAKESLNGALTCVGIILPPDIYEVATEVRKSYGRIGKDNVTKLNQYGEWEAKFDGENHLFSKWEVWLINELNKYGLSR